MVKSVQLVFKELLEHRGGPDVHMQPTTNVQMPHELVDLVLKEWTAGGFRWTGDVYRQGTGSLKDRDW